jgi:hypothetical protein
MDLAEDLTEGAFPFCDGHEAEGRGRGSRSQPGRNRPGAPCTPAWGTRAGPDAIDISDTVH